METLAQRHRATLLRTLIGFCFLSFFCGGLYLVYYGWTNLRDARASIDWPTTEGNIVASQSSQVYGDNILPGGIEYVYRVDGATYSSDVIVFGQGYTHDHLQRYPVGKAVTVTYDPNDVTNAVLEPGEFNNFAPFYIGGAVLFFLGCVILAVVYELVRTVYRAFRRNTECLCCFRKVPPPVRVRPP